MTHRHSVDGVIRRRSFSWPRKIEFAVRFGGLVLTFRRTRLCGYTVVRVNAPGQHGAVLWPIYDGETD